MADLKIGDAAPQFTLTDQNGNEVTLADFKGKTVVLYFYPKDDTPGCTKEACSFKDARAAFAKAKAVVLGVSGDNAASHEKFIRKYSLPFTLLSDPDKKVCRAYGVFRRKLLYGKSFLGIVRSTFVIDPKGRIAEVFPKVKVDGHTEEVLEALKKVSEGAQESQASRAR